MSQKHFIKMSKKSNCWKIWRNKKPRCR